MYAFSLCLPAGVVRAAAAPEDRVRADAPLHSCWREEDALCTLLMCAGALTICWRAQVKTYEFMGEVIKDMHVRGAGLIGAAAGDGCVRVRVCVRARVFLVCFCARVQVRL